MFLFPVSKYQHGAKKPSGEAVNKSLDNLVTSAVATVANTVTSFIPTPIASFANSVASFFGFDRPMTLTVPTRVAFSVATDACANYGLDQSTLLSACPPSGPVVLPTGVGDDMSLQSLVTVPSLLFVSTRSSFTGGSTVFSFPCDPRYLVPVGNTTVNTVPYACYDPTTLAVASLPFNYWRGSMKYRMYIFAPSFLTARFVMRFDPMISTLGSTPYSDAIHRVFDVCGDTVVDFTVPYTFSQAFSPSSTGLISLQCVTVPTIVSGVTTPVVTFALYVAGCSDMQFRELSDMVLLPNQTIGLTDTVTPITDEIEAQSDPRVDFSKDPFESLGGVAVSSVAPDVYFHDSYNHISDLLRRPMTVHNGPQPSPTACSARVLNLTPSVRYKYTITSTSIEFPFFTAPDASASKPFKTPLGVPVNFSAGSPCGLVSRVFYPNEWYIPTYVDHFASVYKYSTGGMRYKEWYSPTSTALVTAAAVPSGQMARPWINYGTPLISNPTGFAMSDVDRSVTEDAASVVNFNVNIATMAPLTVPVYTARTPYVEVEVPGNMPGLWRTTGAPIRYFSSDGLTTPVLPVGDVSCVISSMPNGNTRTAWSVLPDPVQTAVCGADDLRFGYLKGARRSVIAFRGFVLPKTLSWAPRLF